MQDVLLLGVSNRGRYRGDKAQADKCSGTVSSCCVSPYFRVGLLVCLFFFVVFWYFFFFCFCMVAMNGVRLSDTWKGSNGEYETHAHARTRTHATATTTTGTPPTTNVIVLLTSRKPKSGLGFVGLLCQGITRWKIQHNSCPDELPAWGLIWLQLPLYHQGTTLRHRSYQGSMLNSTDAPSRGQIERLHL